MTAKRVLIRPGQLRRGDSVGVVAPAGPVQPEKLEAGLKVIRGMGFNPLPGEHVLARKGFLAGSDTDRAEDLMAMFTNPGVKAIFCARGGYGVNRILPLLNARLIKKNPKILVGSSDLTLLLIYLLQKCGMVPFYGPMVAGSFGCRPMKVSKTRFRKILTGEESAATCQVSHAKVVREGRARGPLAGGCLTLLCRSLGTPYEIDTRGTLLLIEDVNEPPYRIDGMLWQLKAAGKFDKVRGIIFGEMVDCNYPKTGSGRLEEAVSDILGDLRIPILTRCPIGHGNEMWTLPLGVEAVLDTETRSLEVAARWLA